MGYELHSATRAESPSGPARAGGHPSVGWEIGDDSDQIAAAPNGRPSERPRPR
jgi:hypothetical protein